MAWLRRARSKDWIAALLVSAALGCVAFAGPARAFDLFGLFGDKAPEPSASALPYEVTFETQGDDGVESALQQVSNLYKLRGDAPPDGQTLVQRAQADFPPLIDALWSAGYYNARVVITLAGQPLEIARDREGQAARAANAYRGRARVPVKVVAETGPLFRLRAIRTIDRATGLPFTPDDLPSAHRQACARRPLQAAPTSRSRPPASATGSGRDPIRLVKVLPPAPMVDHAALSMDLTLDVETGPPAGIGPVIVKGPKTFPQEVVRSFIYLEEGQPYSPKALEDTRKSIATIPAAGSVRIREAHQLDEHGNLPIFVEVTDRSPNLIGGQLGYSTIDGPTGRAFYENRNLFGGAERLRIEGSAFFVPRNNGSRIKGPGDLKLSDIGERLTVSFLKPALGGSRFDFLFDAVAERNRVGGPRFGGYTDRLVGETTSLRYRFDETLSATVGPQIRARPDLRRDLAGQLRPRRRAADRRASTTPTSRSTRRPAFGSPARSRPTRPSSALPSGSPAPPPAPRPISRSTRMPATSWPAASRAAACWTHPIASNSFRPTTASTQAAATRSAAIATRPSARAVRSTSRSAAAPSSTRASRRASR